MWMAGLHVPESYITAIVQIECRKNGWSLDHSTLYTTVTQYVNEDEIQIPPEMVIFKIQGINLLCHPPPIPKFHLF